MENITRLAEEKTNTEDCEEMMGPTDSASSLTKGNEGISTEMWRPVNLRL